MGPEDKKSTIDQFGEDVAAQFKINADSFLKVFDDLSRAANKINETFTQGRQRVFELRNALADAGPEVLRLGGQLGDVSNIISDVAEASRRNVVASTEEVSKLFAAQQVLGLGAKDLGDAFLDVGMGIESVGKTLEESVQYVQSIGGNAKSVMKDVTNNMDQMNRYQFEGGVVGLTKMAAQASMLRFDMSQTFQLAEKVLTPEGAIETAAAFQRLGVAAGNLVDPFALMNASINDPSGLQNSLVDVAKQFTYFDEKTKTFKINPQGVLTLKEIQSQTGVNASEMTKLGLAAAEADRRISQISPSINIDEDDRQYLANIAKMNEGGTYVVNLRDDAGVEQTRKLSEITQDEFNKLIEEQKNRPKTLEEIARSQMTTTDIMMNDLKAIRNKFVGGIVTAGQVQETSEGFRRGITTTTGALERSFDAKDVRREADVALKDLGDFVKNLQSGKGNLTDNLSDYLGKLGTQMGGIETKFKDALTKVVEDVNKGVTDKTMFERLLKDGTSYILEKTNANINVNKNDVKAQTLTSLLEGRQSQIKEVASSVTAQSTQKSQVEFVGGIKFDFNFNGISDGLTTTQKTEISKVISQKFEGIDFMQHFAKTQNNVNPYPIKKIGNV